MDKNFMNNIKVDMVSEDQMSEEERRNTFDRKPSIDAIPDLDVLTKNVFAIVQYLDTPEVRKQLKEDSGNVKMFLNNKYADDVPLGIITLLLNESTRIENLERIIKLFDTLLLAKKGDITLEKAEEEFSEEVNDKYLYSKYGSKEAFHQALAKESKASKD